MKKPSGRLLCSLWMMMTIQDDYIKNKNGFFISIHEVIYNTNMTNFFATKMTCLLDMISPDCQDLFVIFEVTFQVIQ